MEAIQSINNDRAMWQEFERVVGAQNGFTSENIPEIYTQALIATTHRIHGVLRPHSSKEIQEIVKIASRYGQPLYPISTGKNWGYGSAFPSTEDSIVLDLSRLKEITILDRERGVLMIEPGVTQGELYAFITNNNLNLRMDPSGGGPQTGVLGNILERGVGAGRYGDHFASVGGFEAVLANGEIVRTGFWHYPDSKMAHYQQWGVGPALHGIFSQSNFGVVTRASLWLEPKPQVAEALYFQCASQEKLLDTLNGLSALIARGILPGTFVTGNNTRIIETRRQYPWELSHGKTPLDSNIVHSLAQTLGFNAWNGMLPIYGDCAMVKTIKRIVKRELAPCTSKLIFMNSRKVKILEFLSKFKPGSSFHAAVRGLKLTFDILRGIPTEASLVTPYWRNQKVKAPKEKFDPAKDNCGLIWFVPALPLTSMDVAQILKITEPVHKKYGFDHSPGFIGLSSRALLCSLPILFDRSNQQQCEQAQMCFDELAKVCAAAGYYPYRTPVNSMSACVHKDDSFWKLVKTIKDAIDPHNIIAPGRYCP